MFFFIASYIQILIFKNLFWSTCSVPCSVFSNVAHCYLWIVVVMVCFPTCQSYYLIYSCFDKRFSALLWKGSEDMSPAQNHTTSEYELKLESSSTDTIHSNNFFNYCLFPPFLYMLLHQYAILYIYPICCTCLVFLPLRPHPEHSAISLLKCIPWHLQTTFHPPFSF